VTGCILTDTKAVVAQPQRWQAMAKPVTWRDEPGQPLRGFQVGHSPFFEDQIEYGAGRDAGGIHHVAVASSATATKRSRHSLRARADVFIRAAPGRFCRHHDRAAARANERHIRIRLFIGKRGWG